MSSPSVNSFTPPLLPFSSNTSTEDAHPSPFQNLKPSILVIVLILSITFLLSISLCLLLRHLNRRCLRHLSSSSIPTTTIITIPTTSSSSSNRHSASRVSPETPAFSIIDSLPLFTFSSIKHRSPNSSADCAVCLSKFEPQDQLRLLPLCCHAFHVHCIDTWLHSNQTCPLCRSPIHASDSDLLKAISTTATDIGAAAESFRLEIGSISRRQAAMDSGVEPRTSYSIGSFEYVVEEDAEITTSQMHRRSISDKEIGGQTMQQQPNLAPEVAAGGRSWLKDYVDRLSTSLSSRALSFRSSGRLFTGSSRRSEIGSLGEYDVEANRVGEEISEMFRWFSGV